MNLSNAQRRYLRSLAHSRKPVVMVGSGGVSTGVIAELGRALADHELVKVRVGAVDRQTRETLVAALCQHTDSVLVQQIGHIAVLYRPAKKPVIKLP
jgi:RNA-binding protein